MPEEAETAATTAETGTQTATAETTEKAAAAEVDWKAEARKWESRAKENATKLKAAEPTIAEYNKLVEASKSDLERAQETAKTAEARIAQVQARAVRAEIRAAASGQFIDADVPFAFLDTAKYVTDDGDIDAAAITGDLTALLAAKPALAKPAEQAAGMKRNPAQGTSGAQLTASQQAAQAVKSGDLRTAGALKADQLLALRDKTSN